MSNRDGEKALHFGDQVALNAVLENGFVSAGGFIDDRVWVDQLEQGVTLPPNLRDCRFSVKTRYQYGQMKSLNRYLSQSGLTLDYKDDPLSDNDKEFQVKYDNYVEEMELNEAENSRVQGKFVTYGSVVQFQHNMSGKYLTASKSVAEFNQKALKLSLEEIGNEGSWFELHPGYKTTSFGAIVRHGDVIKLASTKFPNQFMSVTRVDWEKHNFKRAAAKQIKDQLQVDLGSVGVLTKLVPIHKYPQFYPAFDDVLVGGDNITLLHKDTDSYLSFDKVVGKCHLRTTRKAIQDRLYTNGYWKIEGATIEMSGEPVRYSTTPFRIKHVSSGFYLSARKETLLKKRNSTPDGEIVEELVESSNSIHLVMTDDYLGNDTIWTAEPFATDIGDGDFVSKKATLFLKHATHGWLHEMGSMQATSRKYLRVEVDQTPSERDVIAIECVSSANFSNFMFARRSISQLQSLSQLIQGVPEIKATKIALGNESATKMKNISNHIGRESIRTLSGVVFALSESKDKNPFTRDGIPNRQMQKILRQQDIVPVIISILVNPFKRGIEMKGKKFPAIESPELDSLMKVLKLCHRVLKLFCVDYKQNKMVVARYLEVIEGQLGSAMKAALTLMEVFKDSADLITKYVDEKLIRRFVSLIAGDGDDEGRFPRYVQFLSSVISTGGIELPFNQNAVSDIFLDAKDFKGNRLVYRTKLDFIDGKSLKRQSSGNESLTKWKLVEAVAMQKDQHILMVHEPIKGEWVSLNSFMGKADAIFEKDINDITESSEILLRYHCRCVDLLSELLLGRNRKAFEAIIRMEDFCIRYDDLMKIVFNDGIPYRVRSSYALLLQRLYLDRDPYTREPCINMIYFSESPLNEKGQQDQKKVGFSTELFTHLNPFSEMKDLAPTPGFEDLKEFCFTYLYSLEPVKSEKRGQNMLTSSIVDLVFFLFEYGFYTGVPGRGKMVIEDIRRLIPAIVKILDPSTDWPPTAHRFKLSPDNLIIMQFKEKLCRMMEVIFDVRMNLRSKEILRLFDKKFEEVRQKVKRQNAGSVSARPREMEFLEEQSGRRSSAKYASSLRNKAMYDEDEYFGGDDAVVAALSSSDISNCVEKMFRKPILHPLVAAGAESGKLVEIILELTKYEHTGLKETAFRILFRHMQQKASLVKLTLTIQPLRTSISEAIYQKIQFEAFELRRLRKWLPEESRKILKKKEGRDPYVQCGEALNKLQTLLERPDISPETLYQTQLLFMNLRVHLVLVDILQLPLKVDINKNAEISDRRVLFQSCYSLLGSFCRGNATTQMSIFPFIEMFSQHMGVRDLNVADTISEIVRNNSKHLVSVPEKVVDRFVSLLNGKRSPRWLRFLESMLVVNGQPNKPGQTAVLRLCLDHDLLELSGDSEAQRRTLLGRKKPAFQREKLLAEEEYKKPLDSFLQYHALSIEVLAKCCYGKARSNEVKARAILPFEEVVDNLFNSLNPSSGGKKISIDALRFMRRPYFVFLTHCYTDTNHPTAQQVSRDMGENRYFWSSDEKDKATVWGIMIDDIQSLISRLGKLMALVPVNTGNSPRMSKSKRRAHESELDEVNRRTHVDVVCKGYIPFIQAYYLNHYDPDSQHEEIAEVMRTQTEKLHSTLESLHSLENVGDHIDHESLFEMEEACIIMQSKLKGNVYDPKPALLRRKSVALGTEDAEWNPDRLYQDEYTGVVKAIGSALGIKDFNRMIGTGLRDLASLMSRPENMQYVGTLANFIKQYYMDVEVNSAEVNTIAVDTMAVDQVDLAATSLRLMRSILYLNPRRSVDKQNREWQLFVANAEIEHSGHQLKELQYKYSQYGVPEVAMELISHPDKGTSLASLRLMLALGQGGNREVQQVWYDHLSKAQESSFWGGIVSLLNSSLKAVKSRRKARKNSLLNDEEDTDFGPVMDALTVLEYMCTGAFTGNQNLFRGQPNAITSFDMISELVGYALNLQPELTPAFDNHDDAVVDIITQLFRTLEKCIQGPNDENQEWILKTKIAEVCNRINDVTNAVDDHVVSPSWTRLRMRILYFLLAMMEGSNDQVVARHLLSSLDWTKLKDCYDRSINVLFNVNFDPWKNRELIDDLDDATGEIPNTKNRGSCLAKQNKRKELITPEWRSDLIEESNLYYFLSEHLQLHEMNTGDDDSYCSKHIALACTRKARVVVPHPSGEGTESMCIYHAFSSYDLAQKSVSDNAAKIEIFRNSKPEPLLFHKHLSDGMRFIDVIKPKFLSRLQEEYDEDASIRMKNFVPLLQDSLYHLRHHQKMSNSRFLWWIPKLAGFEKKLPLLLSLLINIWYCLFAAQSHYDIVTDEASFSVDVLYSDHNDWSYPVFRVVMAFHMLLSFIILVLFFVENGAPTVFRKMNSADQLVPRSAQSAPSLEKTRVTANLTPVMHYRMKWWLIFLPSADLTDTSSFEFGPYYDMCYPLFSILGNFVSPLFFIYHLLDILRDPVVSLVLASISRNLEKIFKTAILGVIMIYFFAAVHWAAYSDTTTECSTLFKCFVSYTFTGSVQSPIESSLINFSLPSRLYEDPADDTLPRMLISIAFALLFVIVLLNIVSGIIIDSFGELRDEAQRVKDSLKNECYVCGLAKFKLDEYGKGFNHHISSEHNWFDYLRFYLYIETREERRLTGQEQWAKYMLSRRNLELFPINAAYSVSETKDAQEEMHQDLMARVRELESSNVRIEQAFKSLMERFGDPSS